MNSVIGIIFNIFASWMLARADVFPPSQVFFGDFLCRRPGLPSAAGSAISAKHQPVPGLDLSARSAAVLAVSAGTYVFDKDGEASYPVASMTKLMTALVFLDNNPGWDSQYTISSGDLVSGGVNHLFRGDTVTIKDLFYSSLIASDNVATLALASSTGLDEDQFVAAMNKKARDLGLLSTSFSDPVGLGDDNLSSARDMARLAKAAFSVSEIRQAVTMPRYVFVTAQDKEKALESTDYFAKESSDGIILLGGKTGYTDAAGYCFVGQFSDGSGREVISVVMGSDSKRSRFDQTEAAVRWSLDNFNW